MALPKGAKNVSKEPANKVIDMLRIGMAQKEVADSYDISLSTVKRIVRRKQQALGKKKMGRKTKLRLHCYRRLLNCIRNNYKQQLYMIAALSFSKQDKVDCRYYSTLPTLQRLTHLRNSLKILYYIESY